MMNRDVALRSQLVDQLLDGTWSDNLVGLALNDDPRRRAGRKETEIVHVGRRCDRDESPDFGPPHEELHPDPGAKAHARNPGRFRFGMDLLHPVERRGGVAELADAIVENALALSDSPEIEAQRRKAALDERLIKQLDDLVVHRTARLGVRVQNQRDRRPWTGTWVKTTFEASLGTGKYDFGHEKWRCS